MRNLSKIMLISSLSMCVAQINNLPEDQFYFGNTLFYKPHSTVSCDHLEDNLPNHYFNVAINPTQYLNGAGCGDCLKGVIHVIDDGVVKHIEFKGRVNNKFSGLYYGDIALDQRITYGDSLWPTKWQYFKCPIFNNKPTPTPTKKHKPTKKPSKEPAGKVCKHALMHPNKKVCCPKSCKVCGGDNCNKENEDTCCYSGIIRDHNRPCSKFPAPCVI